MGTRINMTTVTTSNTPTYYRNIVTTNAATGWYFSATFNHWQKVNQGVYAYITPMMFGAYYAQMYMRGTASLCSLEVRTQNDPVKLFTMANQWLTVYADGNVTRISSDYYSIDNPNGAWGTTNLHLKTYWV